MALRISGIELIVKNYGQFLTRSQGANKALINLGLASSRAQQKIASLGSAMDRSARKVSTANLAMRDSYLRVEAALIRIEKAQRAYDFATAKGNVKGQKDALSNLEQALIELEKAQDAVAKSGEQLADAQQAQIDKALQLAKATREATIEYTGVAKSLVGNIPLLGQLAAGGQLSLVTFGNIAHILPIVGAAFTAATVTIKAFGLGLSLIGKIASIAISALRVLGNVMLSVFRGIGSIIAWATRPLRTFMQHVIEIASGIALWRFLRNVGEAFKTLGSEVFNAVAAFQGLEIRLEGLAARDYAQAVGISMAEAFKVTAGSAQELFKWMRQLAVTTPFTMQDIATQFTLANAMGLTIEKTKETTIAITNFAAAWNLSEDVLWRIIYQFGQMTARGKLTGEEMRDLARNMVPINQIMKNLAKGVGMQTEAFREMAMEGGVPVMDFLNEFIRIANTDYADAAKRMARTWTGITNNIKDFIHTFLGIDLLKPVMDRFTGMVADSLDRMIKSESLQNAFKLFGQTLLRGFELLTPAVDKLQVALGKLWYALSGRPLREFATDIEAVRDKAMGIPQWARTIATAILTAVFVVRNFISGIADSISNFADRTDVSFGKMVSGAYNWGLKFIEAFSNGVKGGLQLLTTVIGTITNILTILFKPGSPPKIAPEIDKWGAATMEEWIKGFTLADFDLFNQVTSLLESYFRSLGDSIAKDALIPAIMNSRKAIAEAIDALKRGMAIDLAVDIGLEGLTGVQEQFRLYLETLMKIPAAENAVARASMKVKIAQDALEKARGVLDQFTEALFGIEAAEIAVERAGLRVKAVQDQINAVNEKYDGILARLRKQLEKVREGYDETRRLREIDEALSNQLLTAEERERLEMEKRGIQIERQIRAVEEQRDTELNALDIQLKAAEKAEKDAETRLENLRKEYEAKRALIEAEIELAEKRLKSAQDEEARAKDVVDLLKNQAQAYREEIDLIIENNNLLNEQKKILEELAERAEELPEFAAPKIEAPDMEKFKAELDLIVKEAEEKAKQFQLALQGLADAWKSTGVGDAWGQFTLSLSGLRTELEKILGIGEGKTLFERLSEGWQTIREALGIPEGQTFPDWLAKKIEDLTPILTIGAIIIGGAAILLGGAVLLIVKAGKAFFGSKWFTEDIGSFSSRFQMFTYNLLIASLMFKRAIENIGELFGAGSETEKIFKGWEILKTLFLGSYPALIPFAVAVNLLGKIVGNIDVAVRAFAQSVLLMTEQALWVKDVLVPKLEEAFDKLKEIFDDFAENVLSLFGLTPEGMNEIETGPIHEYFRKLFEGLGIDIGKIPGLQYGGRVMAGKPYVVGEKGPEIFKANMGGYVYPNAQMQTMAAAPVFPGGTIDRSIHIEINPSYANAQSEASIFYDVTAALAVVGRR